MTTFASVRLVTDDLDRLITFYERITGITAVRPVPVFAEIRTTAATLALSSRQVTDQLYDAGTVQPGAVRSAFLEFEVPDTDAEYERLSDLEFVQKPVTMPWGNRSALLLDPDGNLVNLFTRPSAPRP